MRNLSKESCIDFLKERGVPEYKIYHSIYVAELGMRIADKVIDEGISVDKSVIQAGALLHDLGIAATYDDESPIHAAIGGKWARDAGFPESVARCIEAHECVGMPKEEAIELHIPIYRETFEPQTWEEKIVLYADHMVLACGEALKNPWEDPLVVAKSSLPYIQKVWKRWAQKEVTSEHPSIQRLIKLHESMSKYIAKEFIDEIEDMNIGKKIRNAQKEAGIEVPFPCPETL